MTSTFFGLETAKRGMSTQQNALYVTGHNIANANTPGYSRQRVNFVQTTPYPEVGMNRAMIPGQMGTGVTAGTVERIREGFLDIQYQSENNKFGYWQSRAQSLSQMEDIMNEPSKNGLAAVLGEFWQSLQDLSTYPENEGTRRVVLQRAQSVVDTFHYVHESLTSIQNNIGSEIENNLQEINSILKQIGDLNRQIGAVEPNGYLPNDLYDQRDLLVDQLSNYLNVKVEKYPSGGNDLDIAEGIYDIKMVGSDGSELKLVTGSDYLTLGFQGTNGFLSTKVTGPITAINVFDSEGKISKGTISFANSDEEVTFSSGELRGLIESYGFQVTKADGTTVHKGIYPDMLDDLDKLAFTFANVFNAIHAKGYNLDGSLGTDQFFEFPSTTDKNNYSGASEDIKLSENLKPNDIAASTKIDASGKVEAGDGKNALNLGNISSMLLSGTNQTLEGLTDSIDLTEFSAILNGTINSFYEGMIGQLGVDALQANRLASNSQVLADSVDNNRQSVSSVSLDEEMTNMIKFQHAYNAAARQITMIDEMLDKIINGMGVVGR